MCRLGEGGCVRVLCVCSVYSVEVWVYYVCAV